MIEKTQFSYKSCSFAKNVSFFQSYFLRKKARLIDVQSSCRKLSDRIKGKSLLVSISSI